MVQVKKDKYILGQSTSKQIATMGEEIRLDLQLQPVTPMIGATVEGNVINQSNQPVQNALIKIMDNNYEPLLHTVTDASGNYIFNNIPSSTSYSIFAIGAGSKLSQGQGFSLSEGQSKTVNFTLEADPAMQLGIIAGDLYQTGTTTPINGAVVSLYSVVNGVETLSAITYTNQFGQFVFREVATGSYSINISALGYIPTSMSTSLTTAGQIVSLQPTIAVDPNAQNGTVSGVITNNVNAPINRADVILYRVNQDSTLTPVAFTKTNITGVYLFINVPQGTYKVKSNELEIVEVNIEPPVGEGPNIDKLTLSEAITVVPLSIYAKDGILTGVTTLANGYVADIGQESTNDSIIVTATVPLSGEYNLGIKYYSSSASKIKVYSNGTLVSNENSLSATGSESTAQILNKTISLNAGSNSIKLTGGSNAAAPNIGLLTIDKNPFSGSKTPSNFTLANGTFINTNPSDPNFGFVSSIGENGGGPNGGSATITVNAPVAGTYNFAITYAGGNQRTWSIDVNGTFVNNFVVPGTPNTSVYNLSLILQQGNNTIKFYAPGGGTYGSDIGGFTFVQDQYLSLIEAENTTIGGSATINGEFVLNLGGSGNGYIQMSKSVPFTGEYDFIFSYVAPNSTKTARVLVNNVDTGTLYTFEQTASLNIADVKTKTIRINLNSGSNVIKVV